ncbi:MAG: hypothetical protein AAGC63_02045, partial [Propionicimonas sp.]
MEDEVAFVGVADGDPLVVDGVVGDALADSGLLFAVSFSAVLTRFWTVVQFGVVVLKPSLPLM